MRAARLIAHGAMGCTSTAGTDRYSTENQARSEVDWQIHTFGHAVHSFCDLTANAGPTRYDDRLCRKPYVMMREFIAETA